MGATQTYSGQIYRIVGEDTAKDSVSESSAEAYQAISNARDEYENPASVPDLPK